MREIYLDVETQRLAEEVPGGWDNIRAFGLAVAVTWDAEGGFRDWYETDVGKLLQTMGEFDRVVTFNGERFDLTVLSEYGDVRGLKDKSFDVLQDLKRRLGYRVKLESLAQATLGKRKTGSGLDAVRWWRSGEAALRQKVVDYCRSDVELLRDIVEYGRREGFVKVPSQGKDLSVYVGWAV
jgi:DEAD/DEAH box helicase domain-containing protein